MTTSAPGESLSEASRRQTSSDADALPFSTTSPSSEHGFGGDRQRASEAGQKGGSASYEVR